MLKAVFASAKELKVPVIVGASEGERKFLGVRQIAALVKSLRQEARTLKEVVAEQALELRLLKKSMIAVGGDPE